jgi:hypothetical protein
MTRRSTGVAPGRRVLRLLEAPARGRVDEDNDHRRLLFRGELDPLTRLNPLQLGDDPVGTMDVQVLQPVIRVQPSTLLAELGEPGPDFLRRGRDRDRSCALDARPWEISSPGCYHRISSSVAPQRPSIARRGTVASLWLVMEPPLCPEHGSACGWPLQHECGNEDRRTQQHPEREPEVEEKREQEQRERRRDDSQLSPPSLIGKHSDGGDRKEGRNRQGRAKL